MIEFVGKMLVANSKQDKRTLVIYYGIYHQKFVLGTKSFYRTLPMQTCAYLCPLIDLFHLATIDKAWDLRQRSSKRKTPRCLCGVSTLIYHTLIFVGRRQFLTTMSNTNLPFVEGFLEQYQVLWREEHDRLLEYGRHRFQKDLIDD